MVKVGDNDKNLIIESENAKKFSIDVFTAIGIPHSEALIISDILVESDLRGVVTHGIVRLPQYIQQVKDGILEKKLNLQVLKEWSWGGVLDANNGFGHLAAYKTMEWVMDKADKNGIGLAVLDNSEHIGMAAYYPLMAAKRGMIGFMASNTDPLMAPWGGVEARIGNNPFSFAVPTKSYPIVFDIACSEAARGKVFKAQREGVEIPLGWANDKYGNPTTDPNEALEGTMLPFSEHKGYGIAMMVDMLTGMLSSTSPIDRLSQFAFAIKADDIVPNSQFKSNTQDYVEYMKNTTPATGFNEVRVPGENGFKTKEERLSKGIPYEISTIELLNKLAKELEVSPLESNI